MSIAQLTRDIVNNLDVRSDVQILILVLKKNDNLVIIRTSKKYFAS